MRYNNIPAARPAPTPPPGRAQPRHRPAKGIDVPVTLWLPPAEPGPENPLAQPAVLPAWALRRLAAEYAKPGQSILVADTRAFYAGRRQIAFLPLAPHHDPHPDSRPRARHADAGLVVLEIETLPQGVLDIAYPHDQVALVTDYIRLAIHEAADALPPGGVLAIALSTPEPGHGTQRTSIAARLAREAGFTYQQHLAVLTADVHGERITPRLTDTQTRAVNTARRRGIPAPAPVHLDLTIFTRPQKDTRA
jgi:hypothetical protein